MVSNKFLTFAVVVVVASIANVHSTPLEDGPSNRDTHITQGKREPRDYILREDQLAMPGKAGQMQTYNITTSVDKLAAQKISYIRVVNNGKGKDRGDAQITAGGLGEDNITIELKSQMDGGLYFDAVVYAVAAK